MDCGKSFQEAPASEASPTSLLANVNVKSKISSDQVEREASVAELEKVFSPRPSDHVNAKKRLIDTATPFHSVKEAVSKFGGTVDWKANRSSSFEKRKFAEPKPEKKEENQPHDEDLEGTKKLMDEMKVRLEKAQKEEHKAKQDLELTRLKVEQMEQDIANEASNAAKAQLELDEAMHAAAVSELKALEEELEALRKKYDSMVIERDIAAKEAQEAVAASKEIEKTVEDLTLELIATKELLESAKASHLELERERTESTMVEDLQSKLAASSSFLLDLKAEFAAYKQSTVKEQCDERKMLEEVKLNIEKATAEVNSLRMASMSLKSQLEEEKSVLTRMKQKEEMASDAVSSLKDELNRTHSEVASVQMKEKETGEKMIELPKKLEEAEQEAAQAKSLAQAAHLELHKAKEEAEQAKARASEMKSRLLAAQKEIETVKDSEKLAIAATKALRESESARSNNHVESPSEVTLSIEEYDQLCKLAHNANEQANVRVVAVNSQIDMAKESELRSLTKLQELNKELAERRKLLKDAKEKAEKAKKGKLGLEQELRKWRADQEKQRKASEVNQGKISDNKGSKASFEGNKVLKKLDQPSNKTGTEPSSETKTKKKKSFLPRIMMFFNKRKTHPAK